MSRPVEEEDDDCHRQTRPGSLKTILKSHEATKDWCEEGRAKTPIDEHEMIEAWLDEHPSFLHNYFVRKASRSIVDAWLQARTCHSTGVPSSSGIFAAGSASAPVSGSTTPVRKISAHEFEKCSLFLRPMVSTTSDGTPTFLPVTPSETGGSGSVFELSKGPPRKSRQELEGKFLTKPFFQVK